MDIKHSKDIKHNLSQDDQSRLIESFYLTTKEYGRNIDNLV